MDDLSMRPHDSHPRSNCPLKNPSFFAKTLIDINKLAQTDL